MYCSIGRITIAIAGVACAGGQLGNLWDRIVPGAHSVGFRLHRGVDFSRTINPVEKGTPLGLAIWYPATYPGSELDPAMSQLEYRLLEFSHAPEGAARQAFIDAQAAAMVGWRHVGIVPLTLDQARASLQARGRAHRDAARATGRFPVVLILGGPWYLSTTAEILASHGYLVVSPVRFLDEWNDVPTLRFPGSYERALRDAEWALAELNNDPSADSANITTLGHGGGGMLAMLLAMRNREIRAVANIDSANFSNRSSIDELIFYNPRLLRTPYLYIVTADTKQGSDRYTDFENMRFSRRYEVILENPELRHHDLSNVGRAVSAPLGIRGVAEDSILRDYATVQDMLLHFLAAHACRNAPAVEPFTKWLAAEASPGIYSVKTREAIEPAPAIAQVLANLREFPPERLAEAHQRDPEAPVFESDELENIVRAAGLTDQPQLAVSYVQFAIGVQPKSITLYNLGAAVLESAGDRVAGRRIAQQCTALQLPENDWRARAAQSECRERSVRLR